MNWRRRSRYHLEAPGHRISKQHVGERVVYTAWRQADGWRALAYVESADKAKAACEGEGK